MNIKSEYLTESKSLRETVINRVDVLDKVKNLSTIPNDINVSSEMVAEYYEVPLKTIQTIIVKNKDELVSDGLKVVRGKELAFLKEVSVVPKNAPSFTLIPRRAVLRIGMILQESAIAKAVRSHLLDAEEKNVVVPEVTDYSSLSPMLQTLINIEQRQNALEKESAQNKAELLKVTAQTEKVESVVTAIQETLLLRDEDWRKSINSMLNAAAFRIGGKYADLRNESYNQLEERAHCNLKSRLSHMHKRMADAGATKSKIENTTRMDVIESDTKLKEIYSAIVKELSIGSLKLVGVDNA